jgi:hypothetical protein
MMQKTRGAGAYQLVATVVVVPHLQLPASSHPCS